ncbi:LysR family transcriptional regulator [Gemmiger sp.]|uniref:LysR family transcriptional regulator n=1 Tax=Gemmiger sp. TaxID=2049027 RepID=UPI003F0EAF09
MTFDQIRYFCAAAQLGSFSKAAETVHISQPSLCIAVRKLEGEFGVQLFQPSRKGAVLTEAGRIFLQDAQNILTQADLAATHMEQFAQRDRAEVRIAYTFSLADAYIPRLLREFSEQEGRGCCIYSDEMPSDQIAQGLREGRFDFGLGSQIPPDPEIEQIPIAWQRLCLLTPPQDPGTYDDPAEFAAAPLICYRKDYPMYRLLSDLFQERRIQPRILHYGYSEGAIARLVEQGMGIGAVAEIEGLEKYRVRVLHPAWLTGGRYIYLMRHRTRMVTQAARRLQERILAQKKENGGQTGGP